MTSTPTHHDTGITEFVDAVRARLADLPAEEIDDLTEGLEADLTDLVAERGGGALGDPDTYTRELRTAAGLEPVMRIARSRRSAGTAIDDALDAAHDGWDRAMGGLPGRPMEFAESLRPAWWVLRALAAVLVVGLPLGINAYGFGILGWVAIAVAIVVSVQIGRKRWWPGNQGQPGAARGWCRLLLVGLNAFAVLVVLVIASTVGNWVGQGSYGDGYTDWRRVGAAREPVERQGGDLRRRQVGQPDLPVRRAGPPAGRGAAVQPDR